MECKTSAFLYCRGLVGEDENFNTIYNIANKVTESITKLNLMLNTVSDDYCESSIQQIFYDCGKIHFENDLRWWFKLMYQILFKQNDGPRLGQFTKIVSPYYVQNKIEDILNGNWVNV